MHTQENFEAKEVIFFQCLVFFTAIEKNCSRLLINSVDIKYQLDTVLETVLIY